jgi:hypothetical protein
MCAAKAFCDCPAIISHRPGSQNFLKEAQLNPEKDSRIKSARSHVSLEKTSQTTSRWKNEPNQTSSLTSPPTQASALASVVGGFATWGKPELARITCQTQAPRTGAKIRGEGGVICGLIYLMKGWKETRPIQNEGSQ